jgi:hypothetical protein
LFEHSIGVLQSDDFGEEFAVLVGGLVYVLFYHVQLAETGGFLEVGVVWVGRAGGFAGGTGGVLGGAGGAALFGGLVTEKE